MIQAAARTYLHAFAGLSRETWLLSVIMLINRSGTMVLPFMTLYLTSDKMGYSVSQAGYVLGLFGLGAFSGAWVGGKLTDKIGFYPVQVFTLATGGVLFFVLGQMKAYPLICIFTFLLSFFSEAFRPANSTAIAAYSRPENRTRSYALNRLAINLGWAAGSGIGGILSSISFELLFWVDGITCIAAAVLLRIVLKPRATGYSQTTGKPVEKTGSAYRDKPYLLFIGATVLFAAVFFQLYTNLPVYFERELGLSRPYIGLLMALNGLLIAFFEMVLIFRLEGKRSNLYYIFRGVLLVAFAFLLLNIPGGGWLLAPLMILLVTLGEILSMPFMNSYWIGRTSETNRGQYAALYTMAWSLAQTLGPMGGARVADTGGFNLLWFLAGGICILSAWGFRNLERKNIPG